LAIAKTADTTILVLMPGSGDDIQAIKSGIMEIGDVFVVNKGDLPGAQKTASEIMQSLELNKNESGWHAPVDITNAEINEGVEKVWQHVQDHRAFLDRTGKLKERRKQKMEAELAELVASIARSNLQSSLEHSRQVQDLVSKLVDHKLDPHSAAEEVIHEIFTAPPPRSVSATSK
jgi:LAO/AO transport system kinase